MLNRLGQFADRTRSLAAEALEALDAPEADSGGPDQPPPKLVPSIERSSVPDFQRSLTQLVESLSGGALEDPGNLLNQCSVLLTQLDVIREEAAGSKRLSLAQREIASRGSIVELVDSLLSDDGTKGGATSTLLEALEHEQSEHDRTRAKLSGEIKRIEADVKGEISRLKSDIEEQTRLSVQLEHDATRLKEENHELKKSLEKVVADKARLELDKDNNELIDARIIRSAFVSLCANADNPKIRRPIVQMMAGLLGLSPDDLQKAGLTTHGKVISSSKSRLAEEFLQFLDEETHAVAGDHAVVTSEPENEPA